MRRLGPVVVGAFVVGALVLAAVAVYLFAGLGVLRAHATWVSYFEGSVGGLAVGAPVTFRGVPVGSVTDIGIDVDPATLAVRVPVRFVVEARRAGWLGRETDPARLVARGLRARLALQSLVTGQTMVELDFLPDTPARLVGGGMVPEVPALPSQSEQIEQALARLPLDRLAEQVGHMVGAVDALLSSPELGRSLASLSATLSTLQTELPPLLAEARATLAETRQTLVVARGGIGRGSRELGRTLADADAVLVQMQGLVGAGAGPRQDLEQALRNFSEASVSLRGLSRELERNPNALLLGTRP
ncbi:MAG: MlaD family protein [Actinomycetota bacterium]